MPRGGRSSAEPKFFPNARRLRAWLAANHGSRDELWVGYYKVHTGKATLTRGEAVDEALCWGWIDGVSRRIDEERYTIRFTPRREWSRWSAKNITSVERLTREGRMKPPGLEAFEARIPERSGARAYPEREVEALAPGLRKAFAANPKAWKHFQAQPPGYRKMFISWVMAAKKDQTRLERLKRLIEVSAKGKRVDPLAPFKKEV